MNVSVAELARRIDAEIIATCNTEKTVSGIYCCDLLSRVLSCAGTGSAWITVHTHINVVAVALLAEISCVIIPEGIDVEQATIKRAEDEGVTILRTPLSTFEICVRMGDAFSREKK